ncbi:MAG: 8-oxoguanine DNA glycosylase [Clostridia bacterium]|nr:8-oxoguanine DNA glycosylase [Clostridia bacterium]
MKEDLIKQQYILKNQDSFELSHIFECGQCFRWNKEQDGSYTGVFKNNVVNVKKSQDIVFTGVCENNKNIQEVVEDYFDLNRDYEKIKLELSKVDDNLKNSIQYGNGIRILNQDLWETIISFIISANNNIPRIKGIIERLCQNYGNTICWNEKTYYSFPTAQQLENVSVQDYRNMGLGFRDVRLYETTHMILNKEIDLQNLHEESDTFKVREELLKLSGVGPKVADCILLFSSLKRFDVFPIDVWVRRVMNDLYIKNEDETKVNKNLIEKMAYDKFGDLAGIAQQYLFYWKREA